MNEPATEKLESWSDEGVHLSLEQPQALRSRRAGVWLFGLIGLAVAAVPAALGFLFVPALAPFLGVSMVFVAAVFGWAAVPPFVIARLNRPLPVFIGQGELRVGKEVFERGTIRSVALVQDHLEIERRDGSSFRAGPVVAVNPERLGSLLDCVVVSDDMASAEQQARREALLELRPLRERVSSVT